nr:MULTISPECIES: hemolysin family protein [Helcobacillus]
MIGVLAALAVVVATLIAACEAAMMSASKHSLERALEEKSEKKRESVLHLHQDAHTTLSTLALGRVLAESAYVVIITAILFETIDGLWTPLLLAMVMAGLISFIASSASPRTIGRRSPDAVLIRLSPLIRTCRTVLGPLSRLLVHIANAATPGGKYAGGPFATADELRQMVDRASEGEELQDDERDMIRGVFDLGDTLIRELMVPRTDMVTIQSDASAEKAMRLFVRSGFSRIPVIGESVDDLLGMLYFKDVMRAIHSPWNPGADRPVTDIMRQVRFVPEFVGADEVMNQMRTSRVHVAIVTDEYGGVSGIVTIEDILEEIVGDISDEHDRHEAAAVPMSGGAFLVPAREKLSEVGDLFDMEIDDDDVDTIGGLLGKALGRVPIVGSEADAHGLHMVAEKISGRRKRVSAIVVSRAPREAALTGELPVTEGENE